MEFVVCDDSSSDSTWSVISNIQEDRLKAYRAEANRGRVSNYRHILYDLVDGDWVINLDGDDYFTDYGFVTKAMSDIAVAGQFSDNIVAYCYRQYRIKTIIKQYQTTQISEDSILMSGHDYFRDYYKIGGFSHFGTIYKKSMAIEIGDMYTLPYQTSDFHALIRLISQGDSRFNRCSNGFWRAHKENTTVLELDIKQEQSMLTYDAIESFASKFYTKAELSVWRRGMNEWAHRDYVSTYVYHKRDL